MFDFSNQTVVVTGGTRGIGRAVSEAFLESLSPKRAESIGDGREPIEMAKISRSPGSRRGPAPPGEIGIVQLLYSVGLKSSVRSLVTSWPGRELWV